MLPLAQEATWMPPTGSVYHFIFVHGGKQLFFQGRCFLLFCIFAGFIVDVLFLHCAFRKLILQATISGFCPFLLARARGEEEWLIWLI